MLQTLCVNFDRWQMSFSYSQSVFFTHLHLTLIIERIEACPSLSVRSGADAHCSGATIVNTPNAMPGSYSASHWIFINRMHSDCERDVLIHIHSKRRATLRNAADDKAVKTNETEKLVFLFQSVTDLASSGMPAVVVDWIEQRLSVEQMLQTRGTGN
ncbi:hypothetical protein EDD86DRAFT_148598 [Gorgonomyces haynaldii]|nr:hypothetical protein EDD86DRAFT_148598 [Gorgonomyces haynaldii]